MSDMQGALNKAGFKSQTTQRKCESCGKPFQAREPKHRLCPECFKKFGQVDSFDEGYPNYFDEDNLLKPEFVTTLAEDIAIKLGNQNPKMTMHQLRSFYSHVKLQEGALKNKRPFKEVYLKIALLKPFATERASKGKIPAYFEQFIIRNVDKVKDADTFLRGFVEHFQAVVAYCAGTLERRSHDVEKRRPTAVRN